MFRLQLQRFKAEDFAWQTHLSVDKLSATGVVVWGCGYSCKGSSCGKLWKDEVVSIRSFPPQGKGGD
jgi:hypothetical protein